MIKYPMRYYIDRKSYKVKIINQGNMGIALGVIDRDNSKTKRPNTAILYNGITHKVCEKKMSKIEGEGFGEGDYVEVKVELGKVSWEVNGVKEAEWMCTKLGIKYLSFFPVLLMTDKDDEVELFLE